MDNNNSSNVGAVKGLASGYICCAPISATVPTDAGTPLPAAFVNLGYASEDGVTNEIETDTEDTKDWNGTTLATIQTSRSETFVFKLLETKTDVLKEVFGDDNVTVDATTGVITVKSNSNEKPYKVYTIETELSDNRLQRVVIPRGKSVLESEIVYSAGEAVGYELKINCSPDANGDTAKRIIERFEKYATRTDFPATGETGKLYIDIATGKRYRWSNSAYEELTAPTTLKEIKKRKK